MDSAPTTRRLQTVGDLRSRVLAGQPVKVPGTLFLVRRPRRETGQTAGLYLKCECGDETGWIEAIFWGAGKLPARDVEALLGSQVWLVEGTASVHRFGNRETPQIKVDSAVPRVGDDPFLIPGLVKRSASTEGQLGDWLSSCLELIGDPWLRALLGRTLGEAGIWRIPYLRAPGGLFYHHAYVGGLADHVREMASVWLASGAHFSHANQDVTLAGILLHDIGKLDTYSVGPAPQLAAVGHYADHITAGVARLAPAMGGIDGFPASVRDHLLHIIASHHGEKEHGSPVVPATREALIVHHLDCLSSMLNHLEDWGAQCGADSDGWTTEQSPWLKTRLLLRSTACISGGDAG